MRNLQRGNFLKNSSRFSLFGFLIGLTFPIAGTLIGIRGLQDSVSFSAIIQLHLSQPLLQIIDLAPVILGLAGLFIGLKTDQSLKVLNERKDERFKKLIEDAAEVIYITDYKGNFNYFNKRIETVYGYNPKELIGSHFTVLIEPSMVKKVAAFYLQQFENKIPETISDFQILDKQGNPRWVEQTVILNMKNDRVEAVSYTHLTLPTSDLV